MTARKMHTDEVHTDVALVRRLVTAQFPEWATLPVEPLASSGTVNALYRLGDDMVVRLPRMDWGVGAVERELRWLPKLAPLLPADIPVPLRKGAPSHGYPYEWGIYPWLEGENPSPNGDRTAMARELARFVRALHAVEFAGPPSGRSASLSHFDETVRGVLPTLEGVIDTAAATAAWDESLHAPDWPHDPVWVHADLMPGNLLVRDGTLTGVIDWGGFGLGDPACDLAVAWNLLDTRSRAVFRAELDVDDDAWMRGRGWALWSGIAALPYYTETNPVLAENAAYRIGEVLADAR